MNSEILKGKIAGTGKSFYVPFLVTLLMFGAWLIVVLGLVFENESPIYVAEVSWWLFFGIAVSAIFDFLFYKYIPSYTEFKLVQTKDGLEFQICERKQIFGAFAVSSIDFWFEQISHKRRGSVYGKNQRAGTKGGGGISYRLFMKVSGFNQEEKIFKQNLNVWSDFPNDWRYEFKSLNKNNQIFETYDLKKIKIAYENFQKKNP